MSQSNRNIYDLLARTNLTEGKENVKRKQKKDFIKIKLMKLFPEMHEAIAKIYNFDEEVGTGVLNPEK